MSAQSITPPFSVFTDVDGNPLEDGYVYVGSPNLNPLANPIQVYWDAALTVPAAQPIRTIGGYLANSGTPGRLYAGSNYSILVKNKNGSLIYSNLDAQELLNVGFLNVKDAPFNAVGDGVADDTDAINNAILSLSSGGQLYFPPGTYRTTAPINVAFPINNVRLTGAQRQASVILADHTGIALNLATNNQPHVEHLFIKRNTVGARGSRTGTGIRVNGDAGAGSVIQPTITHCRIEGFARGLDMDTTWLGHFAYLTLKTNDISYYFQNNTNQSTTFIACQSNNSVSQHVYADGGAAETGATFIGCEFEGAYKFPAFHVAGGVSFAFYFEDCYLDENNFGSDAGSTFQFFRFDIAGKLKVQGGGVNCSGMADARLIYGRRNASAGKWSIIFDNCQIDSGRSTSPDIDLDALNSNENIYVSPSCRYINPFTTVFLSVDQYSANSLYGVDSRRQNFTDTRFVRFPSTQASSGGVNDLDDYEEGTFIPAIEGTTAAGVGTYTQQAGYYTKVGNIVFFSIYLDWSAHTGTGNLKVVGLPFASSGSSLKGYQNFCGEYNTLVVGAGKELGLPLTGGNTFFQPGASDPAGGATAAVAMDTAARLRITGHYFTN